MTSFAPQSFLWYPTPRAATRVAYISRPMALLFRLPVSLGLLILAGACTQRDGSSTANAAPPPNAEFLVATQDSTFWVSTAGAKLRARGAPLTLAQFDGKFYEVFLADDDRSYRDALLVGLRLYRRDLQ